jgi:hypothetical protein
MTRAIVLFALLGAFCVPCGEARAQPSAPDTVPLVDPIDIPPEHDPLAHAFRRPSERGGFYARGLFNFVGAHSAQLRSPNSLSTDDELSARGFGSGFGLDLGGLLAPWIALHVTGHVGVLWNGDLEEAFGISGSVADQLRLTTYGVAPGATFLAPHGFFLTTAFGVGVARLKYPQNSNLTDPGFFMDLVAGKDFFIGPHFAIGMQMQIVYLVLKDSAEIDRVRSRQFLFGLSVAFDSI